MGVFRSCHGWARAAPRSAVAELEVVRRSHPSRVMCHSYSRVCHEARVAWHVSRRARAGSGAASRGAVGKAVRRRNALQAGRFGLRATRPSGSILAVPHVPAPTPMRTQRLTMRCRRTAPRVTGAALHVRSRLLRAGRGLTSVASFCAPPSQLPRHAPPSLSLGSLGAATRHE